MLGRYKLTDPCTSELPARAHAGHLISSPATHVPAPQEFEFELDVQEGEGEEQEAMDAE